MASHWRNPRYDLRVRSRTVLDQSLALSLGLVTLVLLTSRRFEVRLPEPSSGIEVIQVQEIPETQQLRMPAAPVRPQIPVATMSEDVPEDVTILDTVTDLDLLVAPRPSASRIPARPAPGSDGQASLIWDEAPQLVRMVTPEYPESARKAGVEGRVDLSVVVDEKGFVVAADVITAVPTGIFEEAARQAVMKWRYRPARMRGRAIRARLGQTVYFSFSDVRP